MGYVGTIMGNFSTHEDSDGVSQRFCHGVSLDREGLSYLVGHLGTPVTGYRGTQQGYHCLSRDLGGLICRTIMACCGTQEGLAGWNRAGGYHRAHSGGLVGRARTGRDNGVRDFCGHFCGLQVRCNQYEAVKSQMRL